MATRITMTPEELRTAAQFLDTTREEIAEKISAVESKVNELLETWDGAAQDAFFDSFSNNMLPILKNDFPSVLEGISQQLVAAADTIEQVDEEVATAFRG